jgi:hypothetical protein
LTRRANPWPAFVDLFSALLVLTFGGLLLYSSRGREVKSLQHQNQMLSDSKECIQTDLERYKRTHMKSDIQPDCPGKHIQLKVIGKQIFVAGEETLSGAEVLRKFKPQLDLAQAQDCRWVVELFRGDRLSASTDPLNDYFESYYLVQPYFRVVQKRSHPISPLSAP